MEQNLNYPFSFSKLKTYMGVLLIGLVCTHTLLWLLLSQNLVNNKIHFYGEMINLLLLQCFPSLNGRSHTFRIMVIGTRQGLG